MSIEILRKKIERLDFQLLETLVRRFELVLQIGDLKNIQKKPILNREREKELNELYRKWAKELDLSEGLVKSIFELVLKESQDLQQKQRGKIVEVFAKKA